MWNQENLWITYFTVCSTEYKYSTKPEMKFLRHENNVSEMQLLLLKIGNNTIFDNFILESL